MNIPIFEKSKEACKNSGQEPDDHFPRMEKLVEIGSGAKRDIGNLHPNVWRIVSLRHI